MVLKNIHRWAQMSLSRYYDVCYVAPPAVTGYYDPWDPWADPCADRVVVQNSDFLEFDVMGQNRDAWQNGFCRTFSVIV